MVYWLFASSLGCRRRCISSHSSRYKPTTKTGLPRGSSRQYAITTFSHSAYQRSCCHLSLCYLQFCGFWRSISWAVRSSRSIFSSVSRRRAQLRLQAKRHLPRNHSTKSQLTRGATYLQAYLITMAFVVESWLPQILEW
ncbi:unnamed protein product [Amoebophrya sp. A25]|nr:unnamed protein product [Amoebophrya sp. A25]|eukprot:GSA25T00021162001.1